MTEQHMSSPPSQINTMGGSAYQIILDHIFTYPASYEMPLRTMYTLNCTPRAQPLRSPSSSTDSSPINPQFPWDGTANQVFADSLMAQMSQLSNEPNSLPPSFITSFLWRCFPAELVDVDFPQALTGLDYLKDLEIRRRREVAAAMNRLAIDETTLCADKDFPQRFPGVHQWVNAIEEKERKVEALYTQLYVALRRWVLINELSLIPFAKRNCLAMLNTLYPPTSCSPPTSKLTQATLTKQRDGFFKYISAVERNGPGVLSTLMRQGAAPNDDNGWPNVTRTLGMYLQLANSTIRECADIANVEDLSPPPKQKSRHDRSKVDSGVSLPGTDTRPPTANSAVSDVTSIDMAARPKTPASTTKTSSTLEKIARGLKTIGRSRTDLTEIIPQDAPKVSPQKSKSLRKIRSLGNIGDRSKHTPNSLEQDVPAFNIGELRRQRMRFDAANVAQQKFGPAASHEI